MRWGLVGTGRHAAERILPALRATPGHSLGGVVGSSPERAAAFAAQHQAGPAFPSLDAMLRDAAVDAVFIGTPNDRHRAETELAAATGKHVLVEKPMALTEADCDAMIAACARAGVALGLGFQQRHAPVHREMRRLVATGALGDIVLLHAEWHTAYPPWTNWRADLGRAGSDILGAVGVHALDLLCWLAGAEVTQVAAILDTAGPGGADRTIAATLRFQTGAIATMTCTARARSTSNDVRILGTRGSAIGRGTLGMAPTGRLETVIDGHAESRDLPTPDLYAEQFAAFAAAILRRESPSANGTDGRRSVALTRHILACEGSALALPPGG